MSKEAFEAIKEGLESAIAYARGETEGARLTTYPVEDVDVAAVRRQTGLSQTEFCRRFGFSRGTLTKWEQGLRRPTGASRTLLKVIEYHPQTVLDVVARSRGPTATEQRTKKGKSAAA